MPVTPFASIRRIHQNHQSHHSRDHSHDQKSATDSSGTTSTALSTPSPAKKTTKSNQEFNRQLAKKTWAETEPLLRNDWRWPNPPDGHHSIDTARDYAERVISLPDETVEDLTSTTGRKRKREVRRQTIEEMQWNEGLRTFEQRRDAWTGAVHVYLPQNRKTGHGDVLAMRQDVGGTATRMSGDGDDEEAGGSMDLEQETLDPAASDMGTTLLPHYLSTLPPESLTVLQDMHNPAAERLMYKNLVVEAKTAIAPIPLANVVRACIRGLQDADEWPPKGISIDPLPGRVNREKRRSKIKSLFGLKKDHDGDHDMAAACDDPSTKVIQAGFQSSGQ